MLKLSLLITLHVLGFLAGFLILKAAVPLTIVRFYIVIGYFFSSLGITIFSFQLMKKLLLTRKVSPLNKAILITGCDSGFGQCIALRLDALGYKVFASCLFPQGEGAIALRRKSSDRLHIFELDVTKQESVDKAVIYVRKNLGNSELWAVVNNAGLYKGFHVSWTQMKDYIDCLEVNTLGTVRVTKAFLSLLRKSQGRVIAMASVIARIPILSSSAYAMSKAAVICFCESLRQEMYPWSVKVITIEPEFFATPLTKHIPKQFDDSVLVVPKEVREEFGKSYIDACRTQVNFTNNFGCNQLNKVINCIEKAVTMEEPFDTYKPSRNALIYGLIVLLQNIPRSVLDILFHLSMTVARLPVPKGVKS